jgi:hypothetical protein
LVLSLKSNNLRAEGVEALAVALKGNQVITELDIADNNLVDWGCDKSGIIALATTIPDMRALFRLTFCCNMYKQGACSIGCDFHGLLPKEVSTTSLCTCPNTFSDVTMETSMTEADFSGKGLGGLFPGAIMLSAFLPKCT